MKLDLDFSKVLERKSATKIEVKLDLSEAIKERQSDYEANDLFDVNIELQPFENKYVEGHFEISGHLTVPSTRSLQPTEVAIIQSADEIFKYFEDDFDNENDEDLVITDVENNRLDLYNTVVDYILLAVPSVVLTEEEQKADVMPTGENWQVISEDDFKNKNKKSLPTETRKKLEQLKKNLGGEQNE